jgi:two-component system, NarL family, invasion response regulator UvrY
MQLRNHPLMRYGSIRNWPPVWISLHEVGEGLPSKNRTPEELVEALKKLLRGEKYISDSLAEKLVVNLEKPGKVPHESLSDREFEVMKMIASGKAPREIAALLHLSPRTVNTYRSRVLQKLKLKNSAQLIHYATENKLLN